MKKLILLSITAITLILLGAIYTHAPTNLPLNSPLPILLPPKINTPAKPAPNVLPPLTQVKERVTKKDFGMYIDPSTSPIQPERFSGYHTGVDFEVFPNEVDIPVVVKAICDGVLMDVSYVRGYGGVFVQSCTLNAKPVTILYGHLDLSSVKLTENNEVTAGEIVGNLGNAYSLQTDGERKHLHLSIHTGNDINYQGYTASVSDLSNWIDPCIYICED